MVDLSAELLTDPALKPDRDADIHTFLSVPGITSKEQLPGELRNLPLALSADRYRHNVWTHVYTDGSAEEGVIMATAESTLNTQMVTPLPSRLPIVFSAPTIELRYWLCAQPQNTC